MQLLLENNPITSINHRLMLPIEITLDRITIPAGRRAVDADAVERLKQSIADFGLQHSITVAKRDDAFVLVAGAHRVAAYRELGMERISANVIELTSLQARLLELDENLARNNFTPAERKSATARRAPNPPHSSMQSSPRIRAPASLSSAIT